MRPLSLSLSLPPSLSVACSHTCTLMNHPSHKENKAVGSPLGSTSCNVEEYVYWPGKTILKPFSVPRTLSPCPETVHRKLEICSRMIKSSKMKVFFEGWGYTYEKVRIVSAAPHVTSVFTDICLHLKGPPLLCEEFSGGGNFSFISQLFTNFPSSLI